MPKPPKSRTISYLRADWPGFSFRSLQQVLEEMLKSFRGPSDTQLMLWSGTAKESTMKIMHRRIDTSMILLHIASWTEDEAASIVRHKNRGDNEEADIFPPDGDYDFLNGDGMVLVSNDHCLMMSSGLSQSAMWTYLQKLIQTANEDIKPPQDTETLKLIQIADSDIVSGIQREGVKKVHLGVAQYWETFETQEEEILEEQISFKSLSYAVLNTFFKKDEDRARILNADNVQATLSIKLDGRRKGLSAEELGELVTPVLGDTEEYDDMKLETGKGNIYSHGQIKRQKTVRIETRGKTVRYSRAWEQMVTYFNELSIAGALQE